MKKFLGVIAFIVAFGLVSSDDVWLWVSANVPVWVLAVVFGALFLFFAFIALCALVIAINYDKVDK